VGNPIVDIMGAEGFETIRPHVEAVLRGERVEYEASVHLPSVGPRQYHVIYVPERDEQRQVIGYVASILDVTDRNRAIEEKIRLERMVAQVHLPLMRARTGIWDMDMRTDQVSYTPELEAIFGLEATGLRGQMDFIRLVYPDDVHDLLARRDEA